MKAVFRLIWAVSGAIALAISGNTVAEENCKNWSAASVDPAGGRFPIELRTCDLTYGISAYVEIKNLSDKRVVLAYRIITNDDKHKDSESVLEPGVITRAENCQACAKRHAGLKSWEILTVNEAPADNAGTQPGAPAVASPVALPAFMDKAGTAKKPVVAEPAKVAPAKPLVTPRVEPIAEKPAPLVTAPVVEQPKTEVAPPPKADPAPQPEKKEEGFRAEDGTIIPWDQLPPEFRPRK